MTFAPPTSPVAAPDCVCIGGVRLSRHRPLDGAMGTELRAPNDPAAEPIAGWVRSRPEAVRRVHDDHAAAGAQWITTHTLLAHTVGDAAEATGLVRDAVKIARTAAGDRPVALSLGPGAAPDTTRYLALAAADAGAALVLLETHTVLSETVAAVRAARAAGLPIVALMVFDKRAQVLGSKELAGTAARALADAGASAIGANCQEPETLGLAVEEMAAQSLSVPILVRPSAGIPVLSGKIWVYPRAPEPWAAATAALQARGATLLGGCCGAGPAHISALARLLRPLPRG